MSIQVEGGWGLIYRRPMAICARITDRLRVIVDLKGTAEINQLNLVVIVHEYYTV